ncbi:MAG: cytochrome c [Bryobacterales bacterium]|nr:cytochrome c [Bryobacterales bacterium]
MGARLLICFLVSGLALLPGQKPKQQNGATGRGKTIFSDQCALCHAPDSSEKKLGPGLKGLFKKTKLENGKPVNEGTVRAVIDAGGNGMPGYKDMLTAAQKNDLLAYLKTL